MKYYINDIADKSTPKNMHPQRPLAQKIKIIDEDFIENIFIDIISLSIIFLFSFFTQNRSLLKEFRLYSKLMFSRYSLFDKSVYG